MNAIRAAGVDWEEHWRHLVETRRRAVEAVGSQGAQCDYWDRRAARFARMSREFDSSADPLAQMLRAALADGGTLLDVGAGAGRYTLPLASAATAITAVEPSGAMRAALASELASRGVANVTLVPGTWEEATVDVHDVVLASHVLYPIADVVPFLHKLDAATQRACYITIRVDEMVPQMSPLWYEIWGRERPREPGFLDLYNLLFAIGMRAHARLIPFGSGLGFSSLDAAVEHVRDLLFVQEHEHRHDIRIRHFVETTMPAIEGCFVLPNMTQAAIVWWNKGPSEYC